MRRMRYLALSVGIFVALLTTAATVLAATSASMTPQTATQGQTIIFDNGCFGVVEDPPQELRVAFVQDGQVPDEGASEKTTGHLIERFQYSIVVPLDLPPGDYWVHLECAPGDWATNVTEPGGPPLLTVVGVPITDTEAAPATEGGPTGWWRTLLIVATLPGALVVVHRRSTRGPST